MAAAVGSKKIPVISSPQYDDDIYEAVGTVFVTRVESVSFLRGAVGSFGALFGGKNTMIQEAIDKLKTRTFEDFLQKARSNAAIERIVGFNVSISEAGSNEQMTNMVMTMIGTSLISRKSVQATSIAAANAEPTQEGGRRRHNQIRRSRRRRV